MTYQDGVVQVWDTNSLTAVCNFGLPDRVFALDMSHVAAVHCLIAVGQRRATGKCTTSLHHNCIFLPVLVGITGNHQDITSCSTKP